MRRIRSRNAVAKGSVFDNNGYWYVKVRLPGEPTRKSHPLKAPGAKHAMRSDRPIVLNATRLSILISSIGLVHGTQEKTLTNSSKELLNRLRSLQT